MVFPLPENPGQNRGQKSSQKPGQKSGQKPGQKAMEKNTWVNESNFQILFSEFWPLDAGILQFEPEILHLLKKSDPESDC